MAGVAGLEPVTSAVTGQRSNQLSYTPAKGEAKTSGNKFGVKSERRKSVRATDAKEVGVGNPAEETCYRPNDFTIANRRAIVNRQAKLFSWLFLNRWLGSRATANRKLLPLAFALVGANCRFAIRLGPLSGISFAGAQHIWMLTR